ncbi:hypothetical protein ACQ4LE_000006 [Meloidogyne hapla]
MHENILKQQENMKELVNSSCWSQVNSETECNNSVDELKEKSKIVNRYEIMKLKCQSTEKVLEFGNIVDEECEKAEMALTVEEVKILIFIAGIPEEMDDLREVSLKFVESKQEDCTLKLLLEECNNYLTKSETKIYENSQSKVEKESEYSYESKVDMMKENKSMDDNMKYSQNKSQENKFYKYQKKKWHQESQVKLEQKICYNCGIIGHISQNCNKPKPWLNRVSRPKENYKSINRNNVGPYSCMADILDRENILIKEKWITESIKLNNKPVEMIVDSGSQISCINEETWKKLGSPKLSQVSYTGIGIGGTEYKIEGKVKVLVEILGKGSVEEVHIVKGQVNLMGLPWLNKFGTSSPLIRKYSKENSLNKSRMNKNLNSPEDQNCKNQNSNKFNQKHIQPQNWKKVLIKKEKPKTWQKPSQFEKDMKVLVMNRNKNGKIVWLPGTIINKVEEKWKIEVPRLKSIVSREDWQIRKPQSMKPNENYSNSVESLKTMKSSIPSQNLENSLMESRSMMKDVSKEKHSRGTKDDVEHEDEP